MYVERGIVPRMYGSGLTTGTAYLMLNFIYLEHKYKSAHRAMFDMYAYMWEAYDATRLYYWSEQYQYREGLNLQSMPLGFFEYMLGLSKGADPNEWTCFKRIQWYFREFTPFDDERKLKKLKSDAYYFSNSFLDGTAMTECHRW